MIKYKNIELQESVASVIRHMNAVEEYREVLQNLQTVWDNLTLLGQLSGTGTDMSNTRQAFNQLMASLVNQLGAETLKKCVLEIKSKAQVAIDILVRNLYERTADIGFLATDEDIREFLRQEAPMRGQFDCRERLNDLRARLRERFSEYVAKYSVYSDIVLMDTKGTILVRLDDTVQIERSEDGLVRRSLDTGAAYVESFGHIDLLPGQRSLIYSYRVTDPDGTALGVLCLCFRFENEMAGIFANLSAGDDWAVITLLNGEGHVIASSDSYHIPVGAPLTPIFDQDYRIVRFGAQEYLAVSASTHGYQGYVGPGWVGHVMLPLQHAFNKDASEMLKDLSREALDAVMSSPSLFGDELRAIPTQADGIQRDLNRSVWNGNVRQSGSTRATNPAFSKILLWEISNTGRRTKDVFERSIGNLHQTVVSAILQDSRFQAALAIDIMDRNLYERANDCRWWALTSAFRQLLAKGALPPDAGKRIGEILAYINGLYTVYANLIVFDAEGRIVAVSNPAELHHVGRCIGEEWHRRALALKDSQGYVVSSFDETTFYDDKHTYIYGAAILSPDNAQVVGGIGIIFDATPQFRAMLCDALPRNEQGQIQSGSFGVFVSRDGTVIACSNDNYAPGMRLPLDERLLAVVPGGSGASLIELDGQYFAAGISGSSGYREYKGDGDAYREEVIAIILVPLCPTVQQTITEQLAQPLIRSDRGPESNTVEIATFRIGSSWYGLRATQVIEAIDAAGITPVPGSGTDLAGYIFYDGLPRPVFQVRHILEPASSNEYDDGGQVVIIRHTGATLFGVRVSDLGDIPEIGIERVLALPTTLAGGCILADAIIPVEGQDDKMLLVLGAERLYSRLAPSVTEPLLRVARNNNGSNTSVQKSTNG